MHRSFGFCSQWGFLPMPFLWLVAQGRGSCGAGVPAGVAPNTRAGNHHQGENRAESHVFQKYSGIMTVVLTNQRPRNKQASLHITYEIGTHCRASEWRRSDHSSSNEHAFLFLFSELQEIC